MTFNSKAFQTFFALCFCWISYNYFGPPNSWRLSISNRHLFKFIDGQNIYLQCLCLRIQILYVTFVLRGRGGAAAKVYPLFERKERFCGVTKNVSPKIFEIDPHHADTNLQADVFNGGGYPLLCIFGWFYDTRSFMPIVEVWCNK